MRKTTTLHVQHTSYEHFFDTTAQWKCIINISPFMENNNNNNNNNNDFINVSRKKSSRGDSPLLIGDT